MGIISVFGSLFHKSGHLPIELCEQSKDDEGEKTIHMETTGEYTFLQELLLCDEADAVEIAETFEKVTGKKLENAELVPTEKKSKILKVETLDRLYFLKVSSINVLSKISEDSEGGEVIYQIIY